MTVRESFPVLLLRRRTSVYLETASEASKMHASLDRSVAYALPHEHRCLAALADVVCCEWRMDCVAATQVRKPWPDTNGLSIFRNPTHAFDHQKSF
jgi:hypothetical protein